MNTTLQRPTPTQYILELARSFPCLERKLCNWNPAAFDADDFHAMTARWSSGEVLCALFILNVWNPGYARSRGWKFDLIEFVGTADGENLAALRDWLDNPYWP